jgi:hypothetical protein
MSLYTGTPGQQEQWAAILKAVQWKKPGSSNKMSTRSSERREVFKQPSTAENAKRKRVALATEARISARSAALAEKRGRKVYSNEMVNANIGAVNVNWRWTHTAHHVKIIKKNGTVVTGNARNPYMAVIQNTAAYKNWMAKKALRAARTPGVPGARAAKKPKKNAGIPLVNRYKITRNGYEANGNILWRNAPNRNTNNAGNKTVNNTNNNTIVNNSGFGRKSRYTVNNNKVGNLQKKTTALNSMARAISGGVAGAAPFADLVTKTFKMLQPSTMQAFSGSKLETVGFDLGAKASGMHTVYFDAPFSSKNGEIPTGLASKIVNVVKLYNPTAPWAAAMRNPETGKLRPTLVLKTRFSFAKSIKTKEELTSNMGQKVWRPIIRAGSANPFYKVSAKGTKIYSAVLPDDAVPINRVGNTNVPEQWYYTPFNELRAPGKGTGVPTLYKGYTAVEPDIIIYYPPGYEKEEPETNTTYEVGPEGEMAECELKAGPGGDHKGYPAETFQLLKGKRSLQMAFERAIRRGEVRYVPKIKMFFIPWFYAKAGGEVHFVNIFNNSRFNERIGHSNTKEIASYLTRLDPDWKVNVLKTGAAVQRATGINAAVASLALDAYRARNLGNVRKLLTHMAKYRLNLAGRSGPNVNAALAAARRAHPTHEAVGNVMSGMRGGVPLGGAPFSTMMQQNLAKRENITKTIEKSVARLVRYGLLVVAPKPGTNRTNKILPYLNRNNRGNFGYASEFSNINNNAPSAAINAKLNEDIRRVQVFLRERNTNIGRSKYTPGLLWTFAPYTFTWVANRAEVNKKRQIFNAFVNAGRNNAAAYANLANKLRNDNAVKSAFINAYGTMQGTSRYNQAKAAVMRQAAQAAPRRRNNSQGGNLASMFGGN